MRTGRIDLALEKAVDTRQVLIGYKVLDQVDNIFTKSFGDQAAMVVADENTLSIAGEQVVQHLASAGRKLVAPFIFPGSPILYADLENVRRLESALKESDAIPLVIGSGTLNDITKLASHYCGRPYMVVATAASMDGYTAYGAAITQNGFKFTYSCPAPRAVLADMEILANAPLKMTASGFADLLGKFTAGADWLIADSLGIEPVDKHAWSLVQDSLRDWTQNPELLAERDPQAVGGLVEGLILTGLAMQALQNSRPASGSEHQFSHFWEMHENVHGVISHGFKVGIGSIASAALYERVLARDLSHINIPALCRAWPTREQLEKHVRESHPDPVIANKAVEQSLAKYIDSVQLQNRLELLVECWPVLRTRLIKQMPGADHLRSLLRSAGSASRPEEIGKDMLELKSSYELARQIRSRYTIFDLATESGCFESCVDELFLPGGFWAPAAPKEIQRHV